jgi:hypothetical protein
MQYYDRHGSIAHWTYTYLSTSHAPKLEDNADVSISCAGLSTPRPFVAPPAAVVENVLLQQHENIKLYFAFSEDMPMSVAPIRLLSS